jgi:predicted CXXCH cytochrome family protein
VLNAEFQPYPVTLERQEHAMKTKWIALLSMLCFAGTARAAGAASISESKHNFQKLDNTVHVAAGQVEDGICVFCHTPHKGASSLLLWNHKFSSNNYAWQDVGTNGKTTGGTLYPTNLQSWSGSTRKCLSCHDGTVSIGMQYWSNASADPVVVMDGTDQTAGKLSNPAYIIPDAATGANLSGNHPVGVPYSYDNQASTYNGITTGPDVRLAQWVAKPTGVKIFGAGGGGAPVAGAAGVECASCHDPHGTGNEFFLRVTKSASALCLSCHQK